MNDLLRMILRGIDMPYSHRKLNRARLHMIHNHGVQPMPDCFEPLVDLIQTLERLA